MERRRHGRDGRDTHRTQRYHDPTGDGEEPLSEFKQFIRGYHEAFPDLTLAVDRYIAEDDLVSIWGRATGTHEGPFMGIEPTGNQIDVMVISVVRVEDGSRRAVGDRRRVRHARATRAGATDRVALPATAGQPLYFWGDLPSRRAWITHSRSSARRRRQSGSSVRRGNSPRASVPT
ncbi:ester cyclase [Halorarum halobium]|uniref:ester cyclase n=1 Tax=Halorarum halobium TaxID=3075121 RepID=UPI0028AA37CE|nr:ester cyclase [Halobaculum sp. XH14]